MKYKAYYTEDPNATELPDGSYLIIEADGLMDCIAKTVDYSDKYFWEFEEAEA